MAGAAGLALTLAFIATAVRAAPDDPHAFVAWANRQASPLPACPTSEDARVAAAIRKVIGAARVVAVGEPTHGAQEPLALRNCLFRLLVENEGFTAIAIESGAAGSTPMARKYRPIQGMAMSASWAVPCSVRS